MALDKMGKNMEEMWIKENEKKFIEEMKRKREEKIKAQLAVENEKKREDLKKMHYMHCPKCGHQMEEITFEKIKIDKCTLCEGIYFDRGELEELLQKKVEENKFFFKKLIGLVASE